MPEFQSPSSSPSPAIQAGLWKRFTERRDLAARDELVRAYLPLARRMAARYAGVSEPFDDLVQVASLGLVNAIERFDPTLGTPFVGFAKPTIMGELKRYFRDKVWTIRVPRSIHDTMVRVEKATQELSLKLRRPPSVEELARHLDLDASDVLEALEAAHNRSPLSLDAPKTAEDGGEPTAQEWVGVEEEGYELVEDRLDLRSVLPGITPAERQMLKLRFVDELAQTEIAEQLGCSQMHVSRMLRRTLERLRRRGEVAAADVTDDRDAEVAAPW